MPTSHIAAGEGVSNEAAGRLVEAGEDILVKPWKGQRPMPS
jgi:hypothetical protein